MVIDTSAIVAILLGEPEGEAIANAIDADPVRLVSAVTWLEAQLVMIGRIGATGERLIEPFFGQVNAQVVAFDQQIATAAQAAWRAFGKGRHKAALNLADCCAYATAVHYQEPLLFKGHDFSNTPVRAVRW